MGCGFRSQRSSIYIFCGSKGRNRPDPIPRPGVKPNADKEVVGKSDGYTPEQLAAWYAGRFKQDPQQN